jgi:hypothetical protein
VAENAVSPKLAAIKDINLSHNLAGMDPVPNARRLAGRVVRALALAALLSAACQTPAPPPTRETPTFDLEEATIADLQQRMQSGR